MKSPSNRGAEVTTDKGREIHKEPIVAWCIVKYETQNMTDNISTVPVEGMVTFDHDTHPPAFDVFTDVSSDSEVLGVVPDNHGTLAVYGWLPVDEPMEAVLLGYEYVDASNPDWDTVIEAKQNYEERYDNLDTGKFSEDEK